MKETVVPEPSGLSQLTTVGAIIRETFEDPQTEWQKSFNMARYLMRTGNDQVVLSFDTKLMFCLDFINIGRSEENIKAPAVLIPSEDTLHIPTSLMFRTVGCALEISHINKRSLWMRKLTFTRQLPRKCREFIGIKRNIDDHKRVYDALSIRFGTQVAAKMMKYYVYEYETLCDESGYRPFNSTGLASGTTPYQAYLQKNMPFLEVK